MPLICSSTAQHFLIALFLLSSRLALEAHAKTFKKTLDTGRFTTSSCAFELGGYSYDLCPLAGEVVPTPTTSLLITSNDRRVPQTYGKRSSLGDLFNFIGVGQMRDEEQSSPNHEAPQCDDKGWNCLMDASAIDETNTGKPLFVDGDTSEISVLVNVDVADNLHAYPSLRLLVKDVGRDIISSADITILCSRTTETKFLSIERGVTYLRLATPHACPKDFILSTEQVDDEGQEEEEGDDDLMPKQGMSTLRKLMVAALFVFIIPMVCGAILLTSPRARKFTINKINGVASALLPLLSIAAVKLRPIGSRINTLNSKLKFPFRPGSNKLVLWAQEDMSLADSEDIMVNGSGAMDEDGWHADGLEEYIPLSVNPRHGGHRQVKSYGATPVVETFEERQEGWLSRFGRYLQR